MQIQGDKLSGKLIYDIENGPSVNVPFKDTPIFVGNKCEIVFVAYDKDHKLTLLMNKVKLMIEPTEKQIVKACGVKN
uniref:Galectin n=1 Tax=Meloidogyne floridensis TaxID=298350 RepID=A0A915NYJ7_9BILA